MDAVFVQSAIIEDKLKPATYYIKAEGEVDIAYVYNNRFWPIEIKWANQLRPKDLKQIQKYNNSEIYGKIENFSYLGNVPIRPLPLALLNIDTIPQND